MDRINTVLLDICSLFKNGLLIFIYLKVRMRERERERGDLPSAGSHHK